MVKVSDKSDTCEDVLQECLNDIVIEEVEYFDDDDDPEAIEIIITGKFKKDAFKPHLDGPSHSSKDRFDDAKPF